MWQSVGKLGVVAYQLCQIKPTVKGESVCSATVGGTNSTDIGNVGNPDLNTAGVYCYRHATAFAKADREFYRNVKPVPWVFVWNFAETNHDTNYCKKFCPVQCGNRVKSYSNVRRVVYGLTQ